MDRWAIRARLTPANRSSWRTQLLVILCICINLVVAQGSAGPSSRSSGSSSKPVSVSLNAKWSETPLYLETSEYLNEEGIHYFWSWIQALQDNQLVDVLPKQQPRQEYETIIKLARDLLNSPAKLSLLKFSLALRSHSPAIAMQHNMAMDVEGVPTQDCDAFAQLSYKPKNLSTVTSISSSQSGHTVENAIACDLSILKKLLSSLDDIVQSEGSSSLTHPIIYKNDHLYPAGSSQSAPLVVILYGEIGTSPFITMHNYLKELADAGRIRYVVRHFLRHNRGGKVSLSGYGVELAIKSTEYKAQDDTRVKGEETSQTVALKKEEIHKPEEVDGFLFSKLKSLYPEKAEKLDDLQNYLIDASKEIATLKVWELQELSLQAAKRILNSPKEEQLKVMRDLSQNFPVMARSLIKEKVDQELKRDIDINQQMFLSHLNLGPSDPALFVNGMYFDVDSMDVFGLLHILRQENRLVEGLHSLLDSAPDLNDRIDRLLRLGVAEDKSEGFQIDVRDSAVIYINDIENDKMYRNWPSGLHELLRPTYPGMLRNVRKNLYHLVLIIDPSKKESFDILKLAESFYVHKAPVRIGFVFAVNKDMSVDGFHDAGVAALNAFNFISQDKTPYEALSFLTDVIAAVSHNSPAKLRDLEPSDVIDLFKKKNPNEDYDLIFGQDSEYDTGRKLAWDFLTRTGLEGSVKALLNGVLLKESHLNADMFEEIVLTEIMKQTPAIQKAVYQGKIQDSDDILDWLMSQKTVMPRVNKRILGGSEEGDRFLDFSLSSTEHKDDPSKLSQDAIPALKENQLISILAAHVRYIDPRPDRCKPVSVWIVEDFESKEGRKLLSNGLNHLRENSDSMRIAPIYKNPGVVTRSIEAALQTLSGKELINFLTKLIDDENIHEKSDDQIVQLVVSSERETFKANLNRLKEDDKIFAIHQNFAKKALSIGKESSAVIINGKILEIPHDEALLVEDFNLIEKYVTSSYGDKVQTELKDVFENPYVCSDGVMKVSAVLLANPQGKTRHEIKYHSDSKGVINIPPADPSAPAIKIVAIVDPVSRGAQKLSPILMALQQVANSELKVFLNCVDKHSDMPLKSFYRFVIEYEPFFGDAHDDSNSYPQWMAYFSSLPSSPLLTLGMMVPENWLVESVRSPYDLDNIHLDEVDSQSGVWADFELEYLLLEGHCFEQSTGAPPRGLQFTLGTKTNPAQVDTIVMANLGYFQLKANPGAWQLKLRENTRSAEIYDIVSHENTDTPEGSSEVAALINSFRSRVIKIRVNKKPGKQHEELLDSSDEYGEDDDNSIWDSFSSWTGSSDATPKKKKTTEDGGEGDRLNIFSVASGHLYERLLRIMMISVLKHTKTPVKFWFLKNYLSPLFKDFLPYMAKHYGFEYELVQYKWPRWLHQQTEKQRIIWGYKILFLDVLFPLNVKKIIFVDADAIVRDDLKKLRDLDLEGAPYGYTPFCDSRKDMEGFRFWKSGYWASHLHGRKYHISALYVVDLQKFRRIAAGDRLRGQYQGLSQDPNSLSNLDQDLPNNMIHQVNIKSLPQEYLFCDTWCSQEDKKKAKVIDLCNNPMTKEPKLTAARRIAPEWQGYDDELKELMEKWRTERNKIASPLDSKPSISDQAQYQAEIPDHQEPLDTEPGQMHTEL